MNVHSFPHPPTHGQLFIKILIGACNYLVYESVLLFQRILFQCRPLLYIYCYPFQCSVVFMVNVYTHVSECYICYNVLLYNYCYPVSCPVLCQCVDPCVIDLMFYMSQSIHVHIQFRAGVKCMSDQVFIWILYVFRYPIYIYIHVPMANYSLKNIIRVVFCEL